MNWQVDTQSVEGGIDKQRDLRVASNMAGTQLTQVLCSVFREVGAHSECLRF